MADSVWVVAGRYRVLGRIGSGGMADVVRAHDELLDRDVAVKVFRSVPPTPDTASGVERQHAELRALARLNHPNLTVLYDGSIVGQDGPAYLVMELIEGGSLAEAIVDGGLSPQRTAEIGAQVADALAYVHKAEMVHRDVKPANILLGGDGIADSDHGRARLTDFGIVRLIGDEPLTQGDMTLGSASYLAPEQTRGSAVGPPADVYALGLSLLEALTGRRSFEGPPLEAAMARLSNDPHIPPGLPQPWPPLLAAMTARDPAARPTAAQVAKALRGADSTTSALTAGPPLPYPVGFGASGGQVVDGSSNPTAYLAPAGPPPVRAPRPPDDPRGSDRQRRGVSPWLIAAIAVILALIVAGIVVLATSGSGGGGGGGATTPATSPSASTTRSSTSRSASITNDTSAPVSSSDDTGSAPQTSSSAPSSSSSSVTSSRGSSSASSGASSGTSSGKTSSSGSTSSSAGAGGGAAGGAPAGARASAITSPDPSGTAAP